MGHQVITCFEYQPESWYRTPNTRKFDSAFDAEVDPPGRTPGFFPEEKWESPPYGGRYSFRKPEFYVEDGQKVFAAQESISQTSPVSGT